MTKTMDGCDHAYGSSGETMHLGGFEVRKLLVVTSTHFNLCGLQFILALRLEAKWGEEASGQGEAKARVGRTQGEGERPLLSGPYLRGSLGLGQGCL
jgi:hypothetical protein